MLFSGVNDCWLVYDLKDYLVTHYHSIEVPGTKGKDGTVRE